MISLGALALGLIIVVTVTAMLLRRQLREKYAVLWLAIGLAVLLLGIFPAALQWLTIALGFQLPANLIFTLAIALLLAVSLHLSWELTRSEERLRRLAEEAAISRLDREQLRRDVAELQAKVLSESSPAPDDERNHGISE